MIASLRPYPELKASGVRWLGKIPRHWEVRRIKYLLQECDKRSVDGGEQLLRVSQYTGVTERRANDERRELDTRAASLTGYKIVEQNDLVVNIMLAWNGSMGVSVYSGICSPAYCVYRFRAHVVPWYFHYLLRSPIYKARIKAVSTGVVESRLRLYTDDLYRLEALLPPHSEQVAIVRYLDYVGRRVRRLVRAKRKLIALLAEQKQAIIQRAVTRGLDPDVPVKDSGVEWLGEAPAHWEVQRLRNITEMRVSNVDKHTNSEEELVRLCNYNDVYKNDHIDQRINFMRATATPQEIKRFRLEKGDVLITKDSETWEDIGVPALVTAPADDLISGYHLALLRPLADKLSGNYLLRALQSEGVACQFRVEAKGVTRYGLSHANIKALRVAIPPLHEQSAIVAHLDKATADIDSAVARAKREIELLEEYHTRLIADVVTGKLDVREVAAALPETDPLAGDDSDEDGLGENLGADAETDRTET